MKKHMRKHLNAFPTYPLTTYLLNKKTINAYIIQSIIFGITMMLLISNSSMAQTIKTRFSQDSEKHVNKQMSHATLLLDWTPNTNHTGIYVAQDKGYYKELGLSLTIQQAGNLSSSQMVANQQVAFGISHQESLSIGRASGLALVSIAAIVQHNTSGFYAKANSNIKSPKDFEGKTYGSWNAPVEQKTIATVMKNVGGNPDLIKHIGIGSLDFFKTDGLGIDFVWGYEGWTGIKANLDNIETVYFPVKEYEPAFDYYTPIIITHESLIKDDPKLIHAFMQATQKGYEYAIMHPQESADILLRAVPEMDKDLAHKSQAYLSPRYKAEQTYWGVQNINVFERYNSWLLGNQLIDQALNAHKMFTNEFIRQD